MVAHFEKDGMKILDGFDALVPYQMVPLDSERPMFVVAGAKKGILRVVDINIVRIREGTSHNLIATEIFPNTRLDFSIVSFGKPGKTQLEHFEVRAPGVQVPVGSLSVSVKEELLQSYVLLFLADNANPKHVTNRSRADADGKMQPVKDTYSKQANVTLTPLGYADVIVLRDLGNPLILDRSIPINSLQSTTPFNVILEATPKVFLAPSIIRVYCCWDVGRVGYDYKVDVGITEGKNCFVEDGTNKFTFAHELGHALIGDALGLHYHNTTTKRLMFWRTLSDATLKLDRVEIDTINSSGTY